MLTTEETALAELGAVAVSAALEAQGAQRAPPNVRPWDWRRGRLFWTQKHTMFIDVP